jgi:hypothetical protein
MTFIEEMVVLTDFIKEMVTFGTSKSHQKMGSQIISGKKFAHIVGSFKTDQWNHTSQ